MLAKFQSPEQICVDIEDNNYTYFTAACPEKQDIIGYCATQPREDYFFLSKIYVRVDYRGKGIARSFLSEVQKSGFEKIRLTVNKNNHGAIAMYRKVGFEKIDEVKTDIGGGFFMDDYIMERMIT
jgi:ribosomal protein S18 acetylase RimI-like enzyme